MRMQPLNRRWMCALGGLIGLAAAGSASAGFSVFADSKVLGVQQTDFSNAALADLTVQSSNKFGGDALAKAGLNFAAGVSTARVHGCVGPPSLMQFSDSAYGLARPWVQFEQLVVSSATLPVGTPVSITIRYSVTSVIEQLEIQNPANTSGTSSNNFNLLITGPATIQRFGSHGATNNWSTISTNGIFSG